jgi:hypothetical protein
MPVSSNQVSLQCGWYPISIEDLQWDYKSFKSWSDEKVLLNRTCILGHENHYCLNRFAIFFTKTLDFIVDPEFTDRMIPSELFEIASMLTMKMKKAN